MSEIVEGITSSLSRASLVNFEKIESQEQEIIQHIRTSGIRKPRETSLIDELLDIRKERRKVFSLLSNQLASSTNQINNLTEELQSVKDKAKSIINERIEQYTTKLKQCEDEKLRLEQRYNDELKIELEKIRFQERLKLEKVHAKFSEKNKLIEAKISEIAAEKEKADNKEAKRIANELLNEAKVELEGKYLNKIQEYKKVLVALSTREQDLEGSVSRYKELVHTFETENSKLKKTVLMLENKIEHNDYRDKTLELQNCDLHASLKTAKEEILTLNETISKMTSDHSLAITQLETQHEAKLSAVDDKIRKMLDGKDREIKGLKQEVQYCAAKLKDSERLLDSINRQFQDGKR